MSKGKEHFNHVYKEENKKKKDSDMDWLPEKIKMLSVLHSTERFCRKEVSENE